MNLLKAATDTKYYKMDDSSPRYLAHGDEPVDFYRKYADRGFLPMKGKRNLQNLFDDSDAKDYRLFNIARDSLAKIRTASP